MTTGPAFRRQVVADLRGIKSSVAWLVSEWTNTTDVSDVRMHKDGTLCPVGSPCAVSTWAHVWWRRKRPEELPENNVATLDTLIATLGFVQSRLMDIRQRAGARAHNLDRSTQS